MLIFENSIVALTSSVGFFQLHGVKVDLLQRKLEAGFHFAHYVPSFGGRSNDRDTICRCMFSNALVPFPYYFLLCLFSSPPFDIDLRNELKEVQKRYSPRRRPFNAWLTCATVNKFISEPGPSFTWNCNRTRRRQRELLQLVGYSIRDLTYTPDWWPWKYEMVSSRKTWLKRNWYSQG